MVNNMRLIDADKLDEKAVEFPNTSIWVPIDAVWKAPTIDAVPVDRGYNKQPSGMFECSICGWMDWDTVLADGRFNFCPNCGARMDIE